uniref:Ankyrin-2-like n=1 Tax=Saccoglossus kowalevskii TaxID=10224 RepID=A0ABM0MZY3_SACKO|nr:PREDICTED: ankyrin-2-like [Saccoglossus kowalevskii]
MAAIRMQCSESDTESILSSSDESYEIEEYDDNERCHDFVLECQGQSGPNRFEPARKVRDVVSMDDKSQGNRWTSQDCKYNRQRIPNTVRLTINHTNVDDKKVIRHEIMRWKKANKPIYVDEKEEHFYKVIDVQCDIYSISVDDIHAASRLLEDCKNGTLPAHLAKHCMISYDGIQVIPHEMDFDIQCHDKFSDIDESDGDTVNVSSNTITLDDVSTETSDLGEELAQLVLSESADECLHIVSGTVEEKLFDGLKTGVSENVLTNLAKTANLRTMHNGMTLLHYAAIHNRSFVCILLYAFTDFSQIIYKQVSDRESVHYKLTAADIASKLNHVSFLKELKDVYKVECGFSEIHRAARNGDLVRIRELHKNGADVNTIAEQLEITPLYMACGAGRLDAVKLLIELGANVSLRCGDHGGMCLHRAAEWGHYVMVHYLVSEGHFPDINVKNTKYEHTTLHRAIVGSNPDIIRFLLENKADINSTSKTGVTPLHYAVSCNEIDCVGMLLSQGADVMRTYQNNYSILHHSALKGNLKIFVMLVEHIYKTLGPNAVKKLVSSQAELCTSDYVYLVRGTDRGQPAWHYVHIDRSKFPLFMKNTQGSSLDVGDYGIMVKSGWGEDPPVDVRDCITCDSQQLKGSNFSDIVPLHLASRAGHVEITAELIRIGCRYSCR